MKLLISIILALPCSFAMADQVVDFHIKAGTGSKPWNTLANPIRVKVGEILRFHNDDSIDHYLHTGGSPCPHGTNQFKPGDTYDCVISKPHEASDEDCYDHIQGQDSQVYIQADK